MIRRVAHGGHFVFIYCDYLAQHLSHEFKEKQVLRVDGAVWAWVQLVVCCLAEEAPVWIEGAPYGLRWGENGIPRMG